MMQCTSAQKGKARKCDRNGQDGASALNLYLYSYSCSSRRSSVQLSRDSVKSVGLGAGRNTMILKTAQWSQARSQSSKTKCHTRLSN